MNDDFEEVKPISEAQLYFEIERHARQRWWHEDHLVNQRTTWLLTTQGVLGAAYGYIQYRVADVVAGIIDVTDKTHYLFTLSQFSRGIQVIGFTTCLFMLVGIVAAGNAQEALQNQYSKISLGVTPATTKWGRWTANATPTACLAAWVFAYIIGSRF